MPDPLFFVPLPHADMHAVVGQQLQMDVLMASRSSPAQKRYDMTSVFNKTVGSQTFTVEVTFLAQHNEPPHRFDNRPSVNTTTGLVTATTPGVFLFQVKVISTQGTDVTPIGSVVGRLQVHQQITDWWFGNKSITTAKDDIGHAQPTIYARFSPDQSGADVVGDITGHGYVNLTSADTTKVTIAPRGRLRGVVETTTPVTITGTSPAVPGKTHTLPVRVLDYAKTRGNELKIVKLEGTQNLSERANMVFVAEGFPDTPADRALFTGAVKAAVKRIFNMPRHDPFRMLSHRINVFQLFAPSQERGLTTGFPITDKETNLADAGLPIPFQGAFKAIPTQHRLARLIQLIGLARRNETRAPAALKTLWKKQRPEVAAELDGFPDQLIQEWKGHRAEAFLDAKDTRFGFYLGGRFADGDPFDTLRLPADPPATDNAADPKMQQFVARVHTFFTPADQVRVTPDPRRHPPELYGFPNLTNPGTSIMSYLAGQNFIHPFDEPNPGDPVGKEWVPDDTKLTQSRGLVVVVAYEDIRGGVALNNATMVGVTVNSKRRVVLGMPETTQPERLDRVIPGPPPVPAPPNSKQNLGNINLDFFTNVVTHELGHVFALGDEYEVLVGADPDEATFRSEVGLDNVTRIGVVQGTPPPPRAIDPDKVKWLTLPRMRVASRLLQPAQPSGATIEVQVSTLDIPKWAQEFAQNTLVSLRKLTAHELRRQLPLSRDPREFQSNLRILSKPDPRTGVIRLSFPPGLPGPPRFPAGSALFVPQLRNQQPVTVVDDPVLTFMKNNKRPLNRRPNPKIGVDAPEDPDPGFASPVKNKFRIIGLYEGANHSSLGFYRPAGACKMRNQETADEAAAFCFVCRWLIVNVMDPGQHVLLDEWYPGGKHG